MDIWQAIKNDHHELDALLLRIEESPVDDNRTRLVAAFARAFAAHTEAEEKVVYPVLATIDVLKGRIGEALDEHEAMGALLKRIAAADRDEQMDLLADLEEAFADHVEKEEEEIIPDAADAIDDARAEDLRRRFEAAKKGAIGA
jgi:hemerythrin superfamily protein